MMLRKTRIAKGAFDGIPVNCFNEAAAMMLRKTERDHVAVLVGPQASMRPQR